LTIKTLNFSIKSSKFVNKWKFVNTIIFDVYSQIIILLHKKREILSLIADFVWAYDKMQIMLYIFIPNWILFYRNKIIEICFKCLVFQMIGGSSLTVVEHGQAQFLTICNSWWRPLWQLSHIWGCDTSILLFWYIKIYLL
jgi:hypothetical protein